MSKPTNKKKTTPTAKPAAAPVLDLNANVHERLWDLTGWDSAYDEQQRKCQKLKAQLDAELAILESLAAPIRAVEKLLNSGEFARLAAAAKRKPAAKRPAAAAGRTKRKPAAKSSTAPKPAAKKRPAKRDEKRPAAAKSSTAAPPATAAEQLAALGVRKQREAIDVVRDQPGATTAEVAKALGIDSDAAGARLRRLAKKGRVRQEGFGWKAVDRAAAADPNAADDAALNAEFETSLRDRWKKTSDDQITDRVVESSILVNHKSNGRALARSQ